MSKFEMAVRLYKIYLITEALKAHHGNQSAAARSLGMHRNGLRWSIRTLGIKYGQPEPPKRQPTPLATAALENQSWKRA